MRSHPGVAARMFATLAREGINIMMISTSEIRISCLIEQKYAELAVQSAAHGIRAGCPVTTLDSKGPHFTGPAARRSCLPAGRLSALGPSRTLSHHAPFHS
ncbi:MAG: ACT domain-containing protein [Desulfobacterales bacterium]|nr:ACT domain-containing protein [Desulfobacterales bacterium]